ncbi:MAG: hypothetical protein IPG99_12405 [Ignavibacteria bacterium]|nr:hypothetical protein [Ignavibacteria bacterium]
MKRKMKVKASLFKGEGKKNGRIFCHPTKGAPQGAATGLAGKTNKFERDPFEN